jgi:type IX secretion system PorP/SprF family membrane protein
MNRLFFLILFTFFYLTAFGQSNIRLNNYWENTYYINPASIYSDFNFMLSAAARKQWINFPGAPSTGYFTGTMYSPRWNTQIGIQAMHDKIGYTTMNNIALSYTYSVEIAKNHTLNLGLSGKVHDYFYDMNEANTETIGDPAILNSLSKRSYFNSDIGAEYVAKDFMIGGSVQNFASLFNPDKSMLTNTTFLYALYGKRTKALIRMNYGVCFIQNENLSQVEFNISGYLNFNNRPDLMQLGMVYRTKKELAALFGANLNKNIRLAYSYDFFIGDISRSSLGSHELMLLWKFSRIPECTTCTRLYK